MRTPELAVDRRGAFDRILPVWLQLRRTEWGVFRQGLLPRAQGSLSEGGKGDPPPVRKCFCGLAVKDARHLCTERDCPYK